MRSAPEGLDAGDVADAVGRHWGLVVGELDYFPEGGGAYHWVVQEQGRRAWFVTVDDLDTKPWLGADRDSAFTGLLAAYRTAMRLRRDEGLAWVAAPRPAMSGEPAVRIEARYSLALLPFVEGAARRWGEPVGEDEKSLLVGLLAQLHRADLGVSAGAARRAPGVPGRERLEEALVGLDRAWSGGPFSEPARRDLAEHAGLVAD